MTNIQAFILAFIVLTIQTITLIAFGFNYGKDYTFPTFSLFVLVDFVVCALACTLKVVEER